jgi:hypothetical protein
MSETQQFCIIYVFGGCILVGIILGIWILEMYIFMINGVV